ncbi:type III secretion system protein SctP [Xanthomonas campestris pv. raphani]|uniref:type III secretion system protein SctP n=1 Tax=Xanthomonas campestris TaxID=339 RepID=UPI001E601F59|nr:type III secretion system protein SctP [Xanthomonas campestris]MEB2183997.1 type III secretion system protein SctP [Xanthomonas campestris pv. campestris]MCC5066104.1 type III secretion system protein SctP [Xanthomonas campestris pv. raphani]MCC8685587.1 type III secretion system protein SctP [Xanthomonas campestris]MCC8690499.1 type III secretion system protein SctP [Xanthomonas campestris]MCW1999625.1 type III secretion control protein HpaP [Xanthomonas campestris]
MRKPPVRHVRILPLADAPLRPAAQVTPLRLAQRANFTQLRRRLNSAQLAVPDALLPQECDDSPLRPDAEDAADADADVANDGHDPAPVRSDPSSCLDQGHHGQIARGNDSDALGRQIATEWIRTQRAQMAINHIALRVAEFCNATQVRGAGTWEAWLDINHDLLAQTTLFLRLSPDQLSLRFNTGSPDAREVLCNGKKRLDTALKATLSDTLQVSIEVV